MGVLAGQMMSIGIPIPQTAAAAASSDFANGQKVKAKFGADFYAAEIRGKRRWHLQCLLYEEQDARESGKARNLCNFLMRVRSLLAVFLFVLSAVEIAKFSLRRVTIMIFRKYDL